MVGCPRASTSCCLPGGGGCCCCDPSASACLAYVIFAFLQETLHISEPYELLEGSKPLSPPVGAAASLASPSAHSYPKAQEVMALTACACVLAPCRAG